MSDESLPRTGAMASRAAMRVTRASPVTGPGGHAQVCKTAVARLKHGHVADNGRLAKRTVHGDETMAPNASSAHRLLPTAHSFPEPP